jgi:hypothetical protein
MAKADLEPPAPPASPPWEARPPHRPPRRRPRLCRPPRRSRACLRRIRHRASLPAAADLTSAGGGSRGIWASTKGAEGFELGRKGAPG